MEGGEEEAGERCELRVDSKERNTIASERLPSLKTFRRSPACVLTAKVRTALLCVGKLVVAFLRKSMAAAGDPFLCAVIEAAQSPEPVKAKYSQASVCPGHAPSSRAIAHTGSLDEVAVRGASIAPSGPKRRSPRDAVTQASASVPSLFAAAVRKDVHASYAEQMTLTLPADDTLHPCTPLAVSRARSPKLAKTSSASRSSRSSRTIVAQPSSGGGGSSIILARWLQARQSKLPEYSEDFLVSFVRFTVPIKEVGFVLASLVVVVVDSVFDARRRSLKLFSAPTRGLEGEGERGEMLGHAPPFARNRPKRVIHP